MDGITVTRHESFEQVVLQLFGLIAILMIYTMARLILIHALYVDGGLVDARRLSFRTLSYLDTRHGAGEGHRVGRVASEPTGGHQDGDHSSRYTLLHEQDNVVITSQWDKW